MGREGAFRDEVINRGAMHFNKSQINIPAKQAVDEVIQLIGNGLGGAANASQVNESSGRPTGQVPTHQKPVIPNIGGGTAKSPVKREIKSIADIKKRYDELVQTK